jgi:hypothetical protein
LPVRLRLLKRIGDLGMDMAATTADIDPDSEFPSATVAIALDIGVAGIDPVGVSVMAPGVDLAAMVATAGNGVAGGHMRIGCGPSSHN